jgi:hypothetical protein
MDAKVICDLSLGGTVEGVEVTVFWGLCCKELDDFAKLSTVVGIKDFSVLEIISRDHVGTEGTV